MFIGSLCDVFLNVCYLRRNPKEVRPIFHLLCPSRVIHSLLDDDGG